MWEWYHKEDWSFKNDAFELWYWRRLFRVPWTARRSNWSILKEINPEYWLERLMLKLKLQYFGNLMWRTVSLKRLWCWERLKVEGEVDDREWGGWMALPTQWHEFGIFLPPLILVLLPLLFWGNQACKRRVLEKWSVFLSSGEPSHPLTHSPNECIAHHCVLSPEEERMNARTSTLGDTCVYVTVTLDITKVLQKLQEVKGGSD